MALCGEWERGLAILQKGLESNPFYPGWSRMAPFLQAYRQRDFRKAHSEAEQFKMPQFFWDPLLQAAALAQLGRTEEAGRALAHLLQLRPDFPTKGPWLIRCFVKSEELTQSLLEGLRRAGLNPVQE
jgi:adenylate cyclase